MFVTINTKICEFCGKEYSRPDCMSHIRWVERKVCSTKCGGLLRGKNMKNIQYLR